MGKPTKAQLAINQMKPSKTWGSYSFKRLGVGR